MPRARGTLLATQGFPPVARGPRATVVRFEVRPRPGLAWETFRGMDRMRIRGRPGAGLALIALASLGACESSTAVAVAQDIVTSLAITMNGGNPSRSADPLVLELGDTITLSAVATNPLGLAVPGAAVTWSSSNSTVAQIDDAGLVTAVGTGNAEIQAASGQAVSSIPTVVHDTAAFPAAGD